MSDNTTFIKITNKEIYKIIQEFKEQNREEHIEIMKRLDKTNGKVKLNKWISTTAISLTIALIISLLSNL